MALHFNLCQTRRMNQECSFYTYAIRNTTYSKCFPYAMISSRNNNAFEHLDSFSLALDNLYMHTNRITRAKCRDVIAELFISKVSIIFTIFSSFSQDIHADRIWQRTVQINGVIILQKEWICNHHLIPDSSSLLKFHLIKALPWE